jgi:hypothetical protein
LSANSQWTKDTLTVHLYTKLVTEYHVQIATTVWLRALETHIRDWIASHPEYQTSSGRGTITSQYNEDRFMGPLSLIKNDFHVIVNVRRRFSLRQDRYESTVRFTPESGTFENLRETVETVETKCQDNRNFKLVAKLCEKIGAGCQRGVVDEWRCPWCESTVCVSFHRFGRTFAVSCPCGHFHRHATTNSPPDWCLRFDASEPGGTPMFHPHRACQTVHLATVPKQPPAIPLPPAMPESCGDPESTSPETEV